MEFHLLVSAPFQAPPPPGLQFVQVPPGVSFLSLVPGPVPCLSLSPPDPPQPACALEPLRVGRAPRLLLACSPGAGLRVNGEPCPRLSLLGAGDQIQLDTEAVLHLSLYSRPLIGPPPAAAVGQTCPVCRSPIQPDSARVYVCAGCELALHWDGDEKPPQERLECARLVSICPRCEGALVLEEGYNYLPEL